MSEQPKDNHLSTMDLVKAAESQETRPAPGNGGTQAAESRPMPLLNGDETEKFRSHWNSIQTGFVDEPRTSVEQADSLVAEVMGRIAETFAVERTRLEDQWNHGENVSTEDLRVALQRYRSFFNRLLSL